MKYQKVDSNAYVVRLEVGEQLVSAVEQFAGKADVKSAWLMGLGGASDITLGFYDSQIKEYQWKTFIDLHEIASLQGDIAVDEAGKLTLHVHGSFGGANFQTISGHVQDFTAGATVELYIRSLNASLRRAHDEQTGLKLLDIS